MDRPGVNRYSTRVIAFPWQSRLPRLREPYVSPDNTVSESQMDDREPSKAAELRLEVSRPATLLTSAVLAVLYDIMDVSQSTSDNPADQAG